MVTKVFDQFHIVDPFIFFHRAAYFFDGTAYFFFRFAAHFFFDFALRLYDFLLATNFFDLNIFDRVILLVTRFIFFHDFAFHLFDDFALDLFYNLAFDFLLHLTFDQFFYLAANLLFHFALHLLFHYGTFDLLQVTFRGNTFLTSFSLCQFTFSANAEGIGNTTYFALRHRFIQT